MDELTVKVPDVGEGIAEVELVSWTVAEGQTVARNDIIAEVMTDKATVEVPSPVDGVVRSLGGGIGDVLLVGSPLFTLAVEEGSAPSIESGSVATAAVAVAAAAPSAPAPVESVAVPRQIAVVTAPVALETVRAPRPEGRKPTASPAVRKRARDAGVDLRAVSGSGPAGRIEHHDLDALFAANGSAAGIAATPGHSSLTGQRAKNAAVTDQPIVGIRRKIAEQMVASASTIPHITYVEEIDMTALEELRTTLNGRRADGQPKLTVLPFLMRAMVSELVNYPSMNAHVIEPEDADNGGRKPATLRTFGGVHIGIATQTEGGLVVPVLRHVEAETLWTSATRVGQLAEAARNGTAGPADMSGSTITITSLGALGGLVTTPVINKPETTIIGVNKMVTRPVWIDDAFVPRQMMNLSSSFDHRVIDGWDAANFVQGLKRSLEQPALLFIDQPANA